MTKIELTPVVFRTFIRGGVIALFPADPGDMDPGTCNSYMHIGQHGSADYKRMIAVTRPSTPEEIAREAIARTVNL